MKVACIPAYNEERTIAKVVIGCQEFVDRVIVYDDGSKDKTSIIAERLGADVIRGEQNTGKGQALRMLFKTARKLGADVMITIDADDQHNPADIPKLVEPIEEGEADIVIGARFMGEGTKMPQHRRVVNKILNVLTLEGVADTQSGFRAYGKAAIQQVLPAEMGMGVDSEILLDAASKGLTIEEVPIVASYGVGRTSKLNPFYHTLDVVFSLVKLASIRHPLLSFGVPGLALVVGGLYYLVLTIQLYSSQGTVTVLTLTYGMLAFAITMFGLLALFAGVILFTMSTLIRQERGI